MGIDVLMPATGTDHRMKELKLEPLSPREIQFRVRAGESPESVAESTGWPLDRVSRYADPPMGERAYVADRAQATYIHMTRGGATLAEIVAANTGNSQTEWDSFYADGQWVVSASSDLESAHWTFEPTGNTVHPLNDTARSWMGLEPVRTLSRTDNSAEVSKSDTVVIEHSEPVRLVSVPAPIDESESVAGTVADQLFPADTPPQTKPAQVSAPDMTPKKAKRGRAKVPSWDEILFGGPKNSD